MLWACRNLPAKIGDVLTAEQYREVEELGLLVDRDDQVCLFMPIQAPFLAGPFLCPIFSSSPSSELSSELA